MKSVMRNAHVPKGDIARLIVNVIKFYANSLIMDAIAQREIVPRTIAPVS